jgi:DNA-binding CsgD family transcriptional regulator
MKKEDLLQLLESILLLSEGVSQFDLLSKQGIKIKTVIMAKKTLNNLENEMLP